MTAMNPAPELGPQLKQLRLSGILDSLEARNREAIQGKLAYTGPSQKTEKIVR